MHSQPGDQDGTPKPTVAPPPSFTGQGGRQTATVIAIGTVLSIALLIWIGLLLSEEWGRLGQIARRIAAGATRSSHPESQPDARRAADRDGTTARSPVEPGNPGTWFSAEEDYPTLARERNEQGRVVVSLRIDPAGKVRSCTVVTSSGFASLDEGTCRVAMLRGRMNPLRDANGKPIWRSMTLPVRWELQGLGPGTTAPARAKVSRLPNTG